MSDLPLPRFLIIRGLPSPIHSFFGGLMDTQAGLSSSSDPNLHWPDWSYKRELRSLISTNSFEMSCNPNYVGSLKRIPFCVSCNRTFDDEGKLRHHLEHSGIHWYCKACRQDFVSQASRRQHWRSDHCHEHTGCDRCDINLMNNEQKLEHIQFTSSRHFLCERCRLDFVSPKNLMQYFMTSAVHQHTFCWKCEKNFMDSYIFQEVPVYSWSRIFPTHLLTLETPPANTYAEEP